MRLLLILFCCASLNAQTTYAIQGTIVAQTGVIQNATMVVTDGKIQSLGANVPLPADIPVISVKGVVFPGLIDLHNHLTWNVLPRWKLPATVGNRYDWQAMPEYGVKLSGPQGQMIRADAGCDMERYAEVKALLNGATSLAGTGRIAQACVKGLARNLDVFSGLYAGPEPLRYEVFPMEVPVDQAKAIRDGLDAKTLRSVLFHVSEGKDASAAREFRMFKAQGFLRRGVSIIHGVGLAEADFAEMASAGVGLIWSPRSNLELYGKTLDIAAVLRAGVTLALAPDWSPTGSAGMLDELAVAVEWNKTHGNVLSDAQLFQFVAENPAKLAGAADQIGALAVGMRADFIVLPAATFNAISALTTAKPASLQLVVVGGVPIAGVPEVMSQFTIRDGEKISVCGMEKVLQFKPDTGMAWGDLETKLSGKLKEFGSSLAGLSECGNRN